MFVAGAGTSGRLIATTISAFTNSTTVTLGAAAVTTVSGAYFYFGTDDTAAFVAALAALPSRRASLYIPQGCYLVPTQSFAGFTGLAIYGDGRFVSTLKSSAFFDAGSGFDTPGGQMLNIAATCSRVDVFALGFDGSCDYRKPGQQCVVIDADYTTFASNYAVNSGEYALTFGRNRTSPKMLDLQVIGNRVGPSFADGINVYQTAGALIANNIVDGADDDLIAVGESTGVNIVGNILTARTDLGTTWGRGIAILAGCDGITGSGNSVLTCKQWGLWIASEGGTRIANVHLTGTTLTNCPTVLGPSCVGVFETDNVTLVGTCINNPPYGYGFLIADYNNLSIQGGRIFQEAAVFFHGIRTDPNTTYNGSISFATTWTGLSIEDVQITAPANVLAACIGLYPHSTMTMDTILIQGVKSRQGAAGPYIDIDSARCATVVKVVNNTSMEGRAVNPGAGGIFTVANNN